MQKIPPKFIKLFTISKHFKGSFTVKSINTRFVWKTRLHLYFNWFFPLVSINCNRNKYFIWKNNVKCMLLVSTCIFFYFSTQICINYFSICFTCIKIMINICWLVIYFRCSHIGDTLLSEKCLITYVQYIQVIVQNLLLKPNH